jgi:predicted Zn-dependent protease
VTKRRFENSLWTLTLPALLGFSSSVAKSQPTRSPSGNEMERTFQAAMAAEDRGDLVEAETLLSALHKKHPGVFAVDESLGLLRVRCENISDALPLLEAAVREQPSSDAAHVNLGAAYYQLHRSQPALEEFERAVRINPQNVSAQQSLGRICFENHRPAEGAKAFLAAQRLKPDDSDLKLDCVTALLAADRVDEAQAMLSSFDGADGSARAQSLLGEVDEKEGKFQGAGKHFARAVELEPNEENAWELSNDLLRHWAFDAAVIELKAAAAKFPDSKRMRIGLGAALFGDAKYAEAIPVFADLLAGESDNALYADMLGIVCNAPLQVSSSRCAMLVTFAQAHPTDAKAATSAASWLLSQNGDERNEDLARALLERSLAADPNQPESQFQMGVVLQDSADWKGSIPYLERAVKLKPELAQGHYRLARAYWKTGHRQEGDEQMELQKKFARKEQGDLNRRLGEITALAVDIH